MSLTTLRNMQGYYESVDDANDRYEASQAKKRAEKLPEDEIARRSNILYGKVCAALWKHAHRMGHGRSSVPLATHPECVVQRVIDMLKAKGIESKHIYNEHTPQYDMLEIDLKTVKIG